MILNRRSALLAAFVTLNFIGISSGSNGTQFSKAAFDAALAGNRVIILEITAKWCGACQKQRPIVAKIIQRPEFSGLTVFDADYDIHKNDLLALNAHQLTTLVLYRDGKEVARSSGDTSSDAVEAFFRKAL